MNKNKIFVSRHHAALVFLPKNAFLLKLSQIKPLQASFICFYNKKGIYAGNVNMNIIKFDVGNILEMKKEHPCGGKKFEVLRTGSDIRVKCLTCGRDMTVPRVKLEKNIKSVIIE